MSKRVVKTAFGQLNFSFSCSFKAYISAELNLLKEPFINVYSIDRKKNFSLEHNLMAASVRANNNKFNTLIMFFFFFQIVKPDEMKNS